MNSPSLPSDLLRVEEVAHRLSVSIRTVWRLVARGEAPAPIRLSRKLVRFRADDLERYIRGRAS